MSVKRWPLFVSLGSYGKDPYCWDCHRHGSEVFCPVCGLGFHLDCAERIGEKICASDPYSVERTLAKTCQQCQKIQYCYKRLRNAKKKFKNLDKKGLNSTLKAILTSGQGAQPFPEIMRSKFTDGRFRESYFVHFFNFSVIDDKLNNEEYCCTEELIFDLKRINHAMKIGHEREKTKVIDEYMEKVKEFCREVELCPHCVHSYLVQLEGSIEPCPCGHRLVLVDQTQGFSPWFDKINFPGLETLPLKFPAKLLYYNSSTKIVTIRPFSQLMSLEVPRDNVFHFRAADVDELQDFLKNLKAEDGRRELENALEVLNLHIEKLRQIFGESVFLTEEKRYWDRMDSFFINRKPERENAPVVWKRGRPKQLHTTPSTSLGPVTRSRSRLRKPETPENQDLMTPPRERAKFPENRCETHRSDLDEDSNSSGIGSTMNESIESTQMVINVSHSNRLANKDLPELSANFVANILDKLDGTLPRSHTPSPPFSNFSNTQSGIQKTSESISSDEVFSDNILENAFSFPNGVSNVIEIDDELDSDLIDLTSSREEIEMIETEVKTFPVDLPLEKIDSESCIRDETPSNCPRFEDVERYCKIYGKRPTFNDEEPEKIVEKTSGASDVGHSRHILNEKLESLSRKYKVLSEGSEEILSRNFSNNQNSENTSVVHSCEDLEEKVQRMKMILKEMEQTNDSLVNLYMDISDKKVKTRVKK